MDILVREAVDKRDFAPVTEHAEVLLAQQNDDDRAFDLGQLYNTFGTLGGE